MILALLPFLFWLFILLNFNRKGLSWRISFLSASVVWGVLLTAVTEILSIFRQINFISLVLFWGLAGAVSALIFISTKDNREGTRTLLKAPIFLKSLMASIVLIGAVTALIAAVAAPNNWDSMTYHLGRVMHWIQNQSVADYPTNIVRQIELNPWAEFAVMHLQVLGGGDFFANFVQWFSMLGTVIGVTLIAAEFGADFRAQVYAAVVAATIPMGILQATSTQNDYVVGFWLVCFVYFGILFTERNSWLRTLAAGASLGLAILTKGSAYIYAFPFLGWFLLSSLRSGRRRALRYIPLMLLLVLSINGAHYMRNYRLFGNPLSSDNNLYANGAISGSTLLSNILRNTALEMGTPWKNVNDGMQSTVEGMFKLMYLNINDPKTTFGGTSFGITGLSLHEDIASNSLHFVLILISIVLLGALRDIRKSRNLLPYFLSVNMAFLFFCLYLKWQPWGSRLHLPLFVLWSPAIAVVLSRIPRQLFASIVMIVLLVFSLPYLFYNESRPLLGGNSIMATSRLDQYFKNRAALKESYYDSAALVAAHRCGDIGVQLGGDDWEYPLWVLMKGMSDRQFRIEHIGVSNVSGRLAPSNFFPCALIRTGKDSQAYVFFPSVPSGDLLSGDVPGVKIEGFKGTEGPYPQWNLPKVRWINRPVAKIEIDGLRSGNTVKLIMSFCPHVRAKPKMDVLLNSKILKSYHLQDADKWLDDSIDLPLKQGTNVIEFLNEPLPGQALPPDSLYMLFRRLAVGEADDGRQGWTRP